MSDFFYIQPDILKINMLILVFWGFANGAGPVGRQGVEVGAGFDILAGVAIFLAVGRKTMDTPVGVFSRIVS